MTLLDGGPPHDWSTKGKRNRMGIFKDCVHVHFIIQLPHSSLGFAPFIVLYFAMANALFFFFFFAIGKFPTFWAGLIPPALERSPVNSPVTSVW